MPTAEQNEMITRVGPGAPMGELFRNYWIPFPPLVGPEIDGEPMRVRLLVKISSPSATARDKSDWLITPVRIAERRCCSPATRIADCDASITAGNSIAAAKLSTCPVEPETSRFGQKVRIKAYPCGNGTELSGVDGARTRRRHCRISSGTWSRPENVVVTFRIQECNWLQALEGEIGRRMRHCFTAAPIFEAICQPVARGGRSQTGLRLRPSGDFGVSIASRRANEVDSSPLARQPVRFCRSLPAYPAVRNFRS